MNRYRVLSFGSRADGHYGLIDSRVLTLTDIEASLWALVSIVLRID